MSKGRYGSYKAEQQKVYKICIGPGGFFFTEKKEDWLKMTSPKSQYLQCLFNTTTKHPQEMSERQNDMLYWLKENNLSEMSVFTESSAYG